MFHLDVTTTLHHKQKWQEALHIISDDSTDITAVIPHEILVHPVHTRA